MEKVQPYIEREIKQAKEGEVLFPTDFRGTGSEGAIKMALIRLVKAGAIRRLAHGIYYKPKKDPVLGEIRPGVDEVARKIAKKENIRIKPTGVAALHKLGLSVQVPTRQVYITDGNTKQFRLGKLSVKFKATTHKKFGMKGPISSLLLIALEELDLKNIDRETEKKIRELITKEDPVLLKHDLRLGKANVNDYIIKLLKTADK